MIRVTWSAPEREPDVDRYDLAIYSSGLGWMGWGDDVPKPTRRAAVAAAILRGWARAKAALPGR